jgi:formylglycine-generating enzyme required for sulfatase activity
VQAALGAVRRALPRCREAAWFIILPMRKATHPINCVTFDQAQQYCATRGARLPTAAEWVLAAGGPEGRTYPWGNALPSNLWLSEPIHGVYAPGPARHNLCWRGDGTDGETYPTATCPVGSYPAGDTPLGIKDLAGNVWEWTSTSEQLPEGSREYVVKGGSYELDPLGPLEVRVSDVETHPAKYRAPTLGFRCAR